MEIKNITVRVEAYNESESLPEMYGYLLSEAEKALTGSYAPYSEFHVGAAVLLDNGEVVLGSNQENAAYPSGMCAERVALFHAQTVFPGVPVKMIAITATADHFVTTAPVTPCGACRQVMAEVEKRQTEKIAVVMRGQTGATFAVNGIDELLPLLFHEEKLKKVNK
ncbi:MAG: cytidine deaminase [Bacteroidales bacterium]|nr:cytidine deaminase [Bacteroidales bacterium]